MKRTSGTAIATTHHEVPTMMRIGKSFILPALFLALSATAVVGCNDSPFTVAVDRPLRVVYMSPGPSQQNVPLEAQVSVVFSEEVQEAGFKDEKSFSVQEQAGGGWKTIAGSITWDSKSKTLTFKPAAKLRYSATYRIHLGAGLTKVDSTDTSGGHLPGDIDAVFTTVDPPGLGIVSVDTASGKSPMPRDAGGGKPDAVLVRFTEGVKQSSAVLGANVKFEDVTGAADPISGAGTAIAAAVEYLDGQGNAATDAPSTSALIGTDALLKITPSAQPGYGTVVRLTLVAKNAPDLTGIVSDRATARGGQLTACNPTTGYTCAKGDYVFIFKVEELPALSVVSFIPGDPTDTAGAGVQGVAFDQGTITAVFSEDVDCASITWETSGVSFDSTDPVAPSAVIGGTKTCNGATVTFTAEAPFGYSRDVVGTLTTAVRSARSVFDNPAADPLMGHIQSALNYRFSTVNPPELLVISVKPGSGGGSLVSGNNAGTTKDTIVVTFSEGVRRDVEQLGLDILVEDVTGAVPAAVAGALLWNAAEGDNNADLSGKDNLATFTPSANWQFGTKVRVTFVGGTPPPLDKLRSDRATVQGGQLTTMQTYDLAVETIPDLYVKSVTPGIRTDTAGAGAQGVAFDQGTITAVFSEDVDCPSITWETSGVAFDSTDPVAPSAVISGTKTCNGAAVTFTATAPFGYSRDVVGTLTTAVRSARAVFDNPAADPLMGHLQSALDYRFSTVNPPELRIVSVKPGSGSPLLVSGNNPTTTKDTVVMTLSEGVRRDVEQLGLNIVVEDVTGAVPAAVAGALSWNAAEGDNNADLSGKDNLATFTPTSNWAFGTKVRVTFRGGTPPPLDKLRSDRATLRGGQLTTVQTYDLAVETIPDLYVKGVTPGMYSTTPGAGQKYIPFTTQKIMVEFSEDVDCPSIAAASFAVTYDSTDPVAAGTAVTGNITCAGATAEFDAALPFGYSRDVLTTLNTSIRSARAVYDNPAADPLMGHLQSALDYRFSTVNPPELRIVSVKPGSGSPLLVSGNNPTTTKDTVVMTLSEGVRRDVEQLGLNIIVEDVTGAPAAIPGALAWNAAEGDNNADLSGKDNVATFTPTSNWQFGTKVRVTFRGGTPPPLDKLRSDRATVRGGQLVLNQAYALEVEALPDLYVKSVTPGMYTTVPGGGAQGIDANGQTIVAVFSENVDCASISAATASVTYDSTDPSSPGGVVAGNRVCANDTVTFTAAAPFGYSRDVLATLSASVRSARSALANASLSPAIGHLAADYVARFTTEDPAPLFIASVDPYPGEAFVGENQNILVRFSENIAPSSVTTSPGNVSVYDLTNDPARTANLCPVSQISLQDLIPDGNPDAISCAPASPFPSDSQIEVRIDGLLYDRTDVLDMGVAGPVKSRTATSRGGQLLVGSDPYTYTFNIRPRLKVTTTYPYDLQSGVPAAATISAVFNQPIAAATLENEACAGVPVSLGASGKKSCSLYLSPDGTFGSAVAGTYNVSADATIVTFSPDAELLYASSYKIVVKGNPSSQAVCVDALQTSCVTADYIATFSTAEAPPFVVVSTYPVNGALSVPANFNVVPFRVTFNKAPEIGSLNYDDGAPLNPGYEPNIYVTKKMDYDPIDQTNQVALQDCDAFGRKVCIDADGVTATLKTTGTLEFDTDYFLVITRDVKNTDGKALVSTVIVGFRTQLAGLIGAVIQPSSINSCALITFNDFMDPATLSEKSIWMTYEDAFGKAVQIPVTVTPQDNLGNPGCVVDCMRAEVCPVLNDSDCTKPPRSLGYGTDYRIDLSSYIQETAAAGGKRICQDAPNCADPVGFTFSTEAATVVTSLSSQGVLAYSSEDDRGTLNGAKDVPVNSTIRVQFNRNIDPASLVASGSSSPDCSKDTVLLYRRSADDSSDECMVAIDVSYDAATQTASVTYDPTPAAPVGCGALPVCGLGGTPPPAGNCTSATPVVLEYGRKHRLVVRGRDFSNPAPAADPCPASNGEFLEVCDAQGRFLDGNVTATFTTNPGTTVTASPPENTAVSALTPVFFKSGNWARNVNPLSVTMDNIFAYDNTKAKLITGGLSVNEDDPDSVTFTPLPAYINADNVDFCVTRNVQDHLGNPLSATYTLNWPNVGTAPATNARTPSGIAPASVTPASGTVAGDQVFRLTFPAGANLRDRMLPLTMSDSSILLILRSDTPQPGSCSPGTLPGEVLITPGTQIPTNDSFTFGPAGGQDYVDFKSAVPLKATCLYRITFIHKNMANVYTIGGTTADFSIDYSGENNAPTVTDIQVDNTPYNTVDWTSIMLAPSTNVQANSRVRVTFDPTTSSSMDSSTTAGFRVRADTCAVPGADVAGTVAAISSTNWEFTPSANMTGGTAYNAVITTAVLDIAGNAIAADVCRDFQIENAAPVVVSVVDSFATPIPTVGPGPALPINNYVTVTFSEPIAASSICPSGSATAADFEYNMPAVCGAVADHHHCCRALTADASSFRLTPSPRIVGAGTRGASSGSPVSEGLGMGSAIPATYRKYLGNRTYNLILVGGAGGIADLGGNTLTSETRYFTTQSGVGVQPVALCVVPPYEEPSAGNGTVPLCSTFGGGGCETIDIYFTEPLLSKDNYRAGFALWKVFDGQMWTQFNSAEAQFRFAGEADCAADPDGFRVCHDHQSADLEADKLWEIELDSATVQDASGDALLFDVHSRFRSVP